MPNILDGLGLEGSVLDGLAEWPASTPSSPWPSKSKPTSDGSGLKGNER